MRILKGKKIVCLQRLKGRVGFITWRRDLQQSAQLKNNLPCPVFVEAAAVFLVNVLVAARAAAVADAVAAIDLYLRLATAAAVIDLDIIPPTSSCNQSRCSFRPCCCCNRSRCSSRSCKQLFRLA